MPVNAGGSSISAQSADGTCATLSPLSLLDARVRFSSLGHGSVLGDHDGSPAYRSSLALLRRASQQIVQPSRTAVRSLRACSFLPVPNERPLDGRAAPHLAPTHFGRRRRG